ncbi:RNA binding motif protein 34 [Acyrthosiphon pisum]|uniref:ACYPI010185 protein n=1 Tax=Acyrthosiphon pisum TaxID=7029 RepID=C4WXB6_ACYPI|nr:RNA binding motif protein 34 [Acyrthosiphon pisum]BAH72536.1 ACYPI010185 [Acyrthosiphon pisum]|eukprot:NP_001156572.1 RNA binding motif protein 34 [Acyrthosiphon pisum]
MDSEYKVGALCELIASSGNKKKTKKDKKKKKNIEGQLQSETNLSDLSKNENVEKSKKRKSKKNSNEESIKKIKNDLNSQEIEAFDIKPEKIKKTNGQESLVSVNNKTNQINEDSNSGPTKGCQTSETFEKKIKKKKNKKPKDNSTVPNDKTRKIEKKSSKTDKPDIKSSEDYAEKESRTVFVGNVPVSVKMSAVKKLFKQFGEVETTRLRSVAVKNLEVPKRVSIMKGDFHPQRDTANVYVRFKTIEEAQKALVLNATQFEGHTIRVDMALNSNHKQNMKKGIFIGNLPYSIQEDEIWDYFKDCGTISAVRIVRDNATGVSKGFGYVDFETKESVELAMQIKGKKVQNREIRVKRIENNKNINKVFNKRSLPFKRTKPMGKSGQNFQGEIMKPKMHKKKQKPSKTDLMRKKIAKKLNH